MNIDMESFLGIDYEQQANLNYISSYRIRPDATLGSIYLNILDEYRKYQGFTWAIVCEKIGISSSTLSTIKTQQRNLPVDTTIKLLEVLNIPLEYFAKILTKDRAFLMEELDKKSDTSILRNEIGQMLRKIKNVEDLKGIRDFISYTIDKRKKEENSW